MQDYRDEKRDVEDFITRLVKEISEPNKKRVADILTGVALAERTEEKPRYPHSIPTQCG